jgi:uracil-DNA glycosylase
MSTRNAVKNHEKQILLENLNRRIKRCKSCHLSETREHALVGEGNPDSRLMLIALSPGKEENIADRMFVGPSGKVLDRLFKAIAIDRQSVYMTNLIKCMLPKNRKPKTIEIAACRQYIDEEIAIIHPPVLVPLGYYATRYVLQKYHSEISASHQAIRQIYGKLLYEGNQKIYPLYHPASVIYNPGYEPESIRLYGKLPVFLTVCKWYALCPLHRFYEQGMLDRKWIDLYCKGDWVRCERYKMEEQGYPHPDRMLPDGSMNFELKLKS